MKPTDTTAAERRKLAELVGARENASVLFQSKVVDEDIEWAGGVLLQQLDFVNGVNSLYTNFDLMSDTDVTDWGTRCWANTVAHLCEGDTEVRNRGYDSSVYIARRPRGRAIDYGQGSCGIPILSMGFGEPDAASYSGELLLRKVYRFERCDPVGEHSGKT